MDSLDGFELQIFSGVLMLAALFVLREFASGALKKAGEEFWLWVRRGHSGGHAAGTDGHDHAGMGDHADEAGQSGEHVERGVADDGSPCLLLLDRGEARAAATRRLPMRGDAASDSHRKSA